VNAFTIYTEIDGITRFPPARQFFSCCRLGRGRTTRGGALATARGSNAGSRYLKLTFSHAGIRAVQYYAEIRAFFKAKARKKPIRIVRILVALELAGIVYHVLATQQAFTGQFKGRTLSHRMPAKWPRRASPAA
jgi:transposase